MGCDGKRRRIHVDGRIHPKPFSKSSDGTTIQLILAENSNGHERQSFDIGSYTTLKVLFNNYTEKRGVSLRSLRFSYCGKTLFFGNRTPQEMCTKIKLSFLYTQVLLKEWTAATLNKTKS